MMTRVIVCGGREFNDRELCFSKLDQILPEYENPEIVSGHAKGADLLGEKYAKLHSLPLKVFPAEWKKYGRGAGPVRNRQMLQYALEEKPLIIAFWNGVSPGTKDMVRQAEDAGAEVRVVKI